MKYKINKDGLLFNLLGSVRKIIALLLTVVFCYLSIRGKITQDQFIPVFSMVIGYYFGKSTALDVPNNITDKTLNSTQSITQNGQVSDDSKEN